MWRSCSTETLKQNTQIHKYTNTQIIHVIAFCADLEGWIFLTCTLYENNDTLKFKPRFILHPFLSKVVGVSNISFLSSQVASQGQHLLTHILTIKWRNVKMQNIEWFYVASHLLALLHPSLIPFFAKRRLIRFPMRFLPLQEIILKYTECDSFRFVLFFF